MSCHLASRSNMTTDVSGPIRKFKRPSGEMRPGKKDRLKGSLCPVTVVTATSPTSVGVGGAGLVFVHQGLDLVLPQTWEQLLVESRVPLFLVEEFSEVLLRHGRLGGAGGQTANTQISSPAHAIWATAALHVPTRAPGETAGPVHK